MMINDLKTEISCCDKQYDPENDLVDEPVFEACQDKSKKAVDYREKDRKE